MKWKYVFIGVGVLFLIGILGYLFFPPTFDLSDKEVAYGSKYKEEYKVTRFWQDYTSKTEVISKVKTDKLGSYEITYKVKIGFMEFTKKQIVKVTDQTKPELTLTGSADTFVCPGREYQDEGAKALDDIDGDLTNNIKVKKEDKEWVYSVKDKAGNKASVTRKLTFDDKTAPTIKLKGSSNINLTVGDSYYEPGFVVSDNCDGDLTNKTVTSGKVDTSKIGAYTLTYSAIDSKNNKANVTRTVKVNSKSANATGNKGTIYLTFDDGPKQGTTNVILDILKEEGVKATFFVTGKGPDNLIQREFNEGHTVGFHTFSHNYQTCYSSVNGFFNDITQVENRVKRLTGSDSKIIRFAGGSSNTVSRHYSTGIMTRLSSEVVNRGYQYYDWNVSSGDAGETKQASGVYSNVTRQLSKNRANIVLMHDINGFTRDAVRNIIRYGKSNGYSFDKITKNTAPYHHHINN